MNRARTLTQTGIITITINVYIIYSSILWPESNTNSDIRINLKGIFSRK